MTQHLKRYSAYKRTDPEWLGNVPEHWSCCSLWSLSRLRLERNPGSLGLLSVFLDRGVIPYHEGGGQVHAPSINLNDYQVVRAGDFVLNNQQAWRGSVGVSPYDGIISPAYVVLQLSDSLDPRFANYLFRSRPLVNQFVVASRGVGDIQRQLHMPSLRRVVAVVPPREEQRAIVRFLGHIDRRIRQFLHARKRLIALLNEQRHAIISRAISKGLNENVRLKPSCVEWLGDVPEHWRIERSRYLFREVDNRSADGSEQHLSMSQRLGLVPSHLVENRTLVSESYAGGKLCLVGDLVLNRLKAHLGVFTVAQHAGVISPDYTVLRPIEPDGVEYFERLLRSPACRRELRIRAKGIVEGFWRLYTDDFYDIRLPVPPSDERRAIVEYCRSATSNIDRVISSAEREMSLLREYRTRLIANLITGTLDVRDAAADLPEVLEVDTAEAVGIPDVESQVEQAQPDDDDAEAQV